jgi:translation initiation factor 5B
MQTVSLCKKFLVEKITYKTKIQASILEVKVTEGYGHTIDVILVNGILKENDIIVVCGLESPIVTTIKALLLPKPLQEMKVKCDYIKHKEIKGAISVKISAQGLEKAVPGSKVLVFRKDLGDDIEDLKDEVMLDLNEILGRVKKGEKGVYVQSSTIGSLEAILEFLHQSKIPVGGKKLIFFYLNN